MCSIHIFFFGQLEIRKRKYYHFNFPVWCASEMDKCCYILIYHLMNMIFNSNKSFRSFVFPKLSKNMTLSQKSRAFHFKNEKVEDTFRLYFSNLSLCKEGEHRSSFYQTSFIKAFVYFSLLLSKSKTFRILIFLKMLVWLEEERKLFFIFLYATKHIEIKWMKIQRGFVNCV